MPFCCFIPARCPSTEFSTALQRSCFLLTSRRRTSWLLIYLSSCRRAPWRYCLIALRSSSFISVVGSAVVRCRQCSGLPVQSCTVVVSALQRPAAASFPSHSSKILSRSDRMAFKGSHLLFPYWPSKSLRIPTRAVRCALYPTNTRLHPSLCELCWSCCPARL